jgi:hypothetical protein
MRTYRTLWTAAFLLAWTCGALPGVQAAGVPGRPAPRPAVLAAGQDEEKNPNVVRVRESKPLYWNEKRLAVKVAFPKEGPRRHAVTQRLLERDEHPLQDPEDARNAPLRPVRAIHAQLIEAEDLTGQIRKKTGVELLIQGSFAVEHLVVPYGLEIDVRELMDTLAGAFNARWYQVRQAWVLAGSPAEAQLVGLTREERVRRSLETSRALFASITPEQWARLARGVPVPLQEFTPAQRQLVLTYLQIMYYNPQSRSVPLPEALQGTDVSLRVLGAGKGADLFILGPRSPSSDPPGAQPLVGFPFYHPETGELLWGVPPPR